MLHLILPLYNIFFKIFFKNLKQYKQAKNVKKLKQNF